MEQGSRFHGPPLSSYLVVGWKNHVNRIVYNYMYDLTS